jgi:UDP-N-acetylmuramyl tripeptide synthase
VRELDSAATVVVNADDPLVASLAEGRRTLLRFGVDDPAHARTGLQHASDSKYCVRCGRPYVYDAVYVGHLGAYRCPACGHARPQLDVAAREIEPAALDGIAFSLETPAGSARVRLCVPGLYNVYNALAAASLALALGVPLAEIVGGLERFRAAFGRFERFAAGDRHVVLLLVKNPAGANEALRTLEDGGVPSTLVVALSDQIADGRDVSWIWDVDFEPVLERVAQVVVSGERAAELALRFTYAGFPRDRIELTPDLEEALDRGLALTGHGEDLVVLPTYTAMLALRAIATRRGLTRPYWEGQPVA